MIAPAQPDAPAPAPALLFVHAAQLLTLAGPDRARRGREMVALGVVRDGAVLTAGGRILAAGPTDTVAKARPRAPSATREIDCRGQLLTPGLVDAHTHLVFGAPRLDDYERRLRGETYEEIAAAGGGIATSVAAVRTTDLAGLEAQAGRALATARACGTTTLEAKTGYGLELAAERKCLQAAAAAADACGLDVPRTFLGAHIVPPEFRHDRTGYVREIVERMLPAFTAPGAAPWAPEFADAFCDPAGFTVEECRAVLAAARARGLKIKLHGEQFARTGGVGLALEFGAVSIDHLDAADESDARALAASASTAVLLPGANQFLGRPWPPARSLLEAGVAVALATDFNPGTCPIVSLPIVMAAACSGMRMSPAEAWTAVTINAAAALDRAAVCGSLAVGKRADLALWRVDDCRAVPYFAGVGLCSGVCAAGRWFAS